MPENVNGVLVLYHHPAQTNAPTIMEHVDAFAKHSRFRAWSFNTDVGFPASLGSFRFSAVVLHYSLFGPETYQLNDYFLSFLDETPSYKIAFFQDEHHYCRDRFAFLDRYRVDCVYTLLEPEYWPLVYGEHTRVAEARLRDSRLRERRSRSSRGADHEARRGAGDRHRLPR